MSDARVTALRYVALMRVPVRRSALTFLSEPGVNKGGLCNGSVSRNHDFVWFGRAERRCKVLSPCGQSIVNASRSARARDVWHATSIHWFAHIDAGVEVKEEDFLKKLSVGVLIFRRDGRAFEKFVDRIKLTNRTIRYFRADRRRHFYGARVMGRLTLWWHFGYLAPAGLR